MGRRKVTAAEKAARKGERAREKATAKAVRAESGYYCEFCKEDTIAPDPKKVHKCARCRRDLL